MTVKGTMLSNDNETLLTAATMGVGIVAGGDWFLGPHIASSSVPCVHGRGLVGRFMEHGHG